MNLEQIHVPSCVADTELGDEAAKTPIKKKDIAHTHDSATGNQRMTRGSSYKVERGANRRGGRPTLVTKHSKVRHCSASKPSTILERKGTEYDRWQDRTGLLLLARAYLPRGANGRFFGAV